MKDRGEHGNYPVSAPIDPQAMKPLIRGALAVLKTQLITKRDETKDSSGAKHCVNARWIHPSHSLERVASLESPC